jgi:hypothetical protein
MPREIVPAQTTQTHNSSPVAPQPVEPEPDDNTYALIGNDCDGDTTEIFTGTMEEVKDAIPDAISDEYTNLRIVRMVVVFRVLLPHQNFTLVQP